MDAKKEFIETISSYILETPYERILKVAINGVDGSGKTKLAENLKAYLSQKGLNVIHTSIDNFHNPKKVRYKQGRFSAVGFYEDSYNTEVFREILLDPLSVGGDLRYQSKHHDLKLDAEIVEPIKQAKKGDILLIDGIFLLKHELRNYFDISIFLDVPFDESFKRMSVRDKTSSNPNDALNLRYMQGQKLYFEACNPKDYADILVNYADYNNPVILKAKD